MPVALTYPGVYIEEVASGVRTIAGVATSVTAFIGRALRGPVDVPVSINNFGEFERVFGGLSTGSALGFAVRDFFGNGGGQALVVRLHAPETGAAAKPASARLDASGLKLIASSPGSWGNALRARVESVDASVAGTVAASLGVTAADLFTLRVRDMRTGSEEQFRNATVIESARRIDRLLAGESQLVRADGSLPAARPASQPLPTGAQTDWDDGPSVGVAEAARASDGVDLTEASFTGPGRQAAKTGLFALEHADLFNLLCIPPYRATNGIANQDVDPGLMASAATYCEARRAMLIMDAPSTWNDRAAARAGLPSVGTRSRNAALWFPRLVAANPLRGGQTEAFAACGAIAGVIARTDATRGPWKAPAGIDASINGALGLTVNLTDMENGDLNPLGINCLRTLPAIGRVVWGARTMQGDDRLGSEWKYIPVRRLALHIEESLFRGTQWVVFEPNDEPLWSQIRLNVGSFMNNLFRQGAFQGSTPREAYFVKCDRETTTQQDINLGIVNVHVGFAALKPAEFVVIRIQQMAGQSPA